MVGRAVRICALETSARGRAPGPRRCSGAGSERTGPVTARKRASPNRLRLSPAAAGAVARADRRPCRARRRRPGAVRPAWQADPV